MQGQRTRLVHHGNSFGQRRHLRYELEARRWPGTGTLQRLGARLRRAEHSISLRTLFSQQLTANFQGSKHANVITKGNEQNHHKGLKPGSLQRKQPVRQWKQQCKTKIFLLSTLFVFHLFISGFLFLPLSIAYQVRKHGCLMDIADLNK